ncbi:hypothetical protein PPSIR1_30330 [Plesiocystis pacifica SIR-1]|uniref:Uncharacterized protein n=1 Tax=Plesiocystis pacifica SIR-1 TaxID=391625 RepID=A6FZ45_9BACT|nr:hypothetical protein [Plesiocystis pacifica]EDM81200.1 hypothetical protein PPSIR1_30330 [Plesiocystis pacifica SIR-1]
MSTVFTANSSGVLVDNTSIAGVQSIDYRQEREQAEVHGLGSDERLAVYYGARRVVGRVRVASTSPELDALSASGAAFQIVANLRHGEGGRSVAFDECHMRNKEFRMASGGHGETIYEFTAVRVREEDAGGAEA